MKRKASRAERLREYARLTRRRAAESGLPVRRQLAEMLWLLLLRGNGPGYYHAAGFWRPEVPWADKIAHMNAKEYRRVLAPLNSVLYRKTSQNKLIEKAVLCAYRVPTAPLIGHLHRTLGRAVSGAPMRGGHDLVREVRRAGLERFCIKPVESWAGQGFRAAQLLDTEPQRVRSLDGDADEDPETFCRGALDLAAGPGFVVEGYLDQHEWYAALNPSSVNTFRVWVLRTPGEEPATRLAYLRMGRQGSLVDNQSAGGVVAPLDLGTGRLGQVIDGLPARRTWPAHPDSGAPVAGCEPPMSAAALAAAESALSVFPHLHFAGVDVAMTPSGPAIIELNTSPDREAAAFTDTPTWGVFGRPG